MPHKDVTGLVDKLKTQKGIVIEQKVIPGANHFFDGKVEPLMQAIGAYLDKRLKAERKPSAAERSASEFDSQTPAVSNSVRGYQCLIRHPDSAEGGA